MPNFVKMPSFYSSPDYGRAVSSAKELEKENRMKAYFPKEIRENVCGLKVNPVTLRTFFFLICAENPLAVGGRDPSLKDAIQVLWFHSDDFEYEIPIPSSFVSNFQIEDESDFVNAVCGWWESNFWDSDNLASLIKQDTVKHTKFEKPEKNLFIDYYIDLFAREYGWTDEYILRIPLRRLYQLKRCILLRYDKDYRTTSLLDWVIYNFKKAFYAKENDGNN